MRISDWSSDVCSSDLELVQRKVALERILGRDRLHRLVRLHRALVNAQRAQVQAPAEAAEAQLQFLRGKPAQVADGGDAKVGRRLPHQIGTASCRDRVGPYVYISVVVDELKKKK